MDCKSVLVTQIFAINKMWILWIQDMTTRNFIKPLDLLMIRVLLESSNILNVPKFTANLYCTRKLDYKVLHLLKYRFVVFLQKMQYKFAVNFETLSIWEEAKKVLFLVARPLKGGGVGKCLATEARKRNSGKNLWPLSSKTYFGAFPKYGQPILPGIVEYVHGEEYERGWNHGPPHQHTAGKATATELDPGIFACFKQSCLFKNPDPVNFNPGHSHIFIFILFLFIFILFLFIFKSRT